MPSKQIHMLPLWTQKPAEAGEVGRATSNPAVNAVTNKSEKEETARERALPLNARWLKTGSPVGRGRNESPFL